LKSEGTRLRSEASARSWILSIAANVWKNELRRRQAAMRAAPDVSLEAEMEHGEPQLRQGLRLGSAPPPNPLASTLTREQVAVAREVLRSMAPQRRRCLLLYGDRQLEVAEIGELLGLSRETVKKHIQLGRQELREEVARRFNHDAGARKGGLSSG
jgi:RNA polymerase sigma factor (sigma-70 family)